MFAPRLVWPVLPKKDHTSRISFRAPHFGVIRALKLVALFHTQFIGKMLKTSFVSVIPALSLWLKSLI